MVYILYQNTMLAYASKRIGYKHDGYATRMELAYLDHNAHINRPQMMNGDGEAVYKRKWGKRTKHWQSVAVPIAKTYQYIPGTVYIFFKGLTNAYTTFYRLFCNSACV